MYVFSALTLVLGTGTVLFGAYVLIQEHRSRAHQVFFALCVSAGCWNLLAAITLSTAAEQAFWVWFRAGSFFLILYISLYLHFALVLTESQRGKWLLAASYAMSVAIHYANLTGYYAFDAVERLNGHWVFMPNSSSPWLYLWILYSHGVGLASGLIILRWGRRSSSRRVRAQAQVVGWALIGHLLLGSFCDFFGTRLLGLPAISPLLFAGCVAAITYAVLHYRFLAITHTSVSGDLLQSMDAVVLLLDQQRRVVTANRKAEAAFGISEHKLEGRQISQLLSPARIIEDGLRHINGSRRVDFTFIAQVKDRPEPLALEATMSLVRDRFGDALGVMLVGHEQRGVADFLRRFHISGREWETIQLVLAELPNREIAEQLGVAERTVKAHVTHIHDKLGIENKIGLFKMLQEYNLLPNMNHFSGAPQRLLRRQ